MTVEIFSVVWFGLGCGGEEDEPKWFQVVNLRGLSIPVQHHNIRCVGWENLSAVDDIYCSIILDMMSSACPILEYTTI